MAYVRGKLGQHLSIGLAYAALSAMALLFLFPVLYMLFISLRPIAHMSELWSGRFTLDGYASVLGRYDFTRYFFNSTIISAGTVALLMVTGLMPAYVIYRSRMRGTLLVILLFRAAPPVGFLLPFFLMFYWLGLLDTHLSLILSHAVRLLPLVIWLMVGYLAELPRELDEAAMVDGCNPLQSLLWVILPSVAPGLVASMIISFVLSWNDLLYALVLSGTQAKTLPVAVSGLQGYASTEWNVMAAGAVIATVPALAFGLLIQRHLVRGLTSGAVKE